MLLDPLNSILLATALFAVFLLRRRSKLPLPPGPPKLPLLGNLFNHPSVSVWKVYMEWSKLYDSDIIHVDIAGTSVVILSSMEAAVNLLDKRSAIYSDRARLPMVSELMGWDFSFVIMKYGTVHTVEFQSFVDTLVPIGDLWRTRRRLFHGVFHAEASKKFRPKQLSTTHQLLRRLLHDPAGIMTHLRQSMTGGVILGAAYGIDVVVKDDPYVRLVEDAIASATEALVPGKFLVDSLPLLKYIPSWFPGAGFQRVAREGKILSQNMSEKPFAEAKRKIASGDAPYSFTAATLQNLDEFPDKEQAIKDTAAVMYGAGTDTIVSALSTFILAMLYNPEAQRKAQAEINSVIKQGHLPDFDDEPYLPYVSALVREVLRWQPVLPLGVAHFIDVEDEYKGYRIPKGSTVIANTWAIFHDEDRYPDPYAFKPERFLLNGKLNPAIQGPEAATFGFGRRICHGRHMAAASVWITITSILATFDITKAVGKDGELVEPSYEYLDRIIAMPEPFECSIKPRSKDTEALIQSTADQDGTF